MSGPKDCARDLLIASLGSIVSGRIVTVIETDTMLY